MSTHKIARLCMMFCTLCILQFILPVIALGQYSNVVTNTNTDISTTYAVNGTNAWKYMQGNPQCQLNSLAVGYDLSIWCVGTDHYPYQYGIISRKWTKQTAMGTGVIAMVVQDAKHVYSMQKESHCGVSGGIQYFAFLSWTGSAWTEPNTSACATNYTVGADGFMAASGMDSSNGERALYSSPDTGVTWNLWSDNWTYVNMQDTNWGCAITTSGTLYMVSTTENASSYPNLPSGTPAGCITTPSDSVVMAWNTAGSVYILDPATILWDTVSGLTANQLAGVGKGNMIALDLTGKPYHWNIYAPGVQMAVSGSWNANLGCPGPSTPCHSSTTHTGKATAYYTSGHGINGGGGGTTTKTVNWNTPMDIVQWDINPGCDPMYGIPADPECVVEAKGDEICNQSGQGVGSGGGDTITRGVSIQNVDWDGYISHNGPTSVGPLGGFAGTWIGTVRSNIIDICAVTGGTPTCTESIAAHTHVCFWSGSELSSASCEGRVQIWMSDEILGENFPYAEYTAYVTDNGETQCFPPAAPMRYNGDVEIMLPCQ
jgi:hypothetical protein